MSVMVLERPVAPTLTERVEQGFEQIMREERGLASWVAVLLASLGMQVPTLKAIEVEVVKLAEEYPETIYFAPSDDGEFSRCLYTRGEGGGGTGCIFGQALVRAGVPVEVLAIVDRGPMPIADLMRALGMVAPRGWSWLQRHQDRRVPWGEAARLSGLSG